MKAISLAGKKMIDRYEQVQVFSNAEYKRRIAGVVDVLKNHDLDLLIIADPLEPGSERSYDIWLANESDAKFVLVDRDGLVTLVYSWRCGKGGDLDQIMMLGRRPISPVHDSVVYRATLDLEYILSKAKPTGRIGTINAEYFPCLLSEKLREAVPQLEMVDLTKPVGLFRAVKSEEELQAVMRTAEVEKKIFKAVPHVFREGRFLRDCLMDLRDYAHELGCNRSEAAVFVLQFGLENDGGELPRGVAFMGDMVSWPNERLAKGFRCSMLIETAADGFHYVESGRHFYFGEPHPITADCYEKSKKMQDFAASLMVPGSNVVDICHATIDYLGTLGVHKDYEIFMHGMGVLLL